MKHLSRLFPFLLLLLTGCSGQQDSHDPEHYTLWYRQPAVDWVEALPLGNGRLGAMVFGGPEFGRLQLNEETLWAGSPNNNVNPEFGEVIPTLRQLLFEKKFIPAQKLARTRHALNNGMPYQPAGNLLIHFPGHNNYQHYKRTLDISKAIATVSYEVNGVRFRREIFISFPDQVIVMRLFADKPGSITCELKATSGQKHKVKTAGEKLILSGISGDHEGVPGKVKFDTQVTLKTTGGNITATDSSLKVNQADTVTVFVSIATNFKNYHDLGVNERQKASGYLNAALQKDYSRLKRDQIAFYQKYFNRVKLDLGITPAAKGPTDARIANFVSGNDPQLAALYFQYGRYLLISSSQPGGQPATLQGIWNDKIRPPWDSKYTININTEMNYWPAGVTNLTELTGPLTQMVTDLSHTGRKSARDVYGARGWMVNHNTDIWRITGVVDGVYWGLWPSGGAWLCQRLWKHYLFTGDTSYLRKIYPVIKGAAMYFVDVLQSDPDNNWLVVTPSISPEHAYIPKHRVSITAGCTMDNQLVFDLFSEVITASAKLGKDPLFADTLRSMRAQLPPMQIGQYSQLQEWLYDWDDTADHHRHLSHLYGLFPGNQISPFRTPELAEAARNSIVYKGSGGTGWSLAWRANLWASLLEGNRSYTLLKEQLKPVSAGGHTFPNLFDCITKKNGAFQIDANFGFTSAIAEMLLQSKDGAIFVLPALPDNWETGQVSGLLARGGFTVDVKWKNSRISEVDIYSKLGGNCRIRSYWPLKPAGDWPLAEAEGENPNVFYKVPHVAAPLVSDKAQLEGLKLKETFLYDVKTEAGGKYTLRIAKN